MELVDYYVNEIRKYAVNLNITDTGNYIEINGHKVRDWAFAIEYLSGMLAGLNYKK